MTAELRVEVLGAIKTSALATLNGFLYAGQVPVELSNVLAVAASTAECRIAVATVDKKVVVFECDDQCLNFRKTVCHVIPKRPTALVFAPEGDIVVSDAFGDVYKLSVKENLDLRQESLADKACLMGHFSTVTDLSICTTHIATCDRDSRIRISRWPECYIIRSFCLGHTDVVTALYMRDDCLLSGAADGSLRLWNFDGECMASLILSQFVDQSLLEEGTSVHLKEGKRSQFVVTGLVSHPSNPDVVLFTLHRGRAIFKVSGLMHSQLANESALVSCDGIITGMAVDHSKLLWVSFDNDNNLRFWDLSRVQMSLTNSDATVLSPFNESGDRVSLHSNADLSRPEWLVQQRKKVMVENWKGKKRRYREVS